MNDYQELLADYETSVDFPRVSGFEILELLDVRSRLALAESQLHAVEKEQLEKADDVFMTHAAEFYEQVAEVADIREMRRRPDLALVVALGEVFPFRKNCCHGLSKNESDGWEEMMKLKKISELRPQPMLRFLPPLI